MFSVSVTPSAASSTKASSFLSLVTDPSGFDSWIPYPV